MMKLAAKLLFSFAFAIHVPRRTSLSPLFIHHSVFFSCVVCYMSPVGRLDDVDIKKDIFDRVRAKSKREIRVVKESAIGESGTKDVARHGIDRGQRSNKEMQ